MSERRPAHPAGDKPDKQSRQGAAGSSRPPSTSPKAGSKASAADGRPAASSSSGPHSARQRQEAQDRGLRRAIFLAELAEAKELRKRVAPRRARAAELHARLLRTFRY